MGIPDKDAIPVYEVFFKNSRLTSNFTGLGFYFLQFRLSYIPAISFHITLSGFSLRSTGIYFFASPEGL